MRQVLPILRRKPRSRSAPMLTSVVGVAGAALAGMLGYQVMIRYGRVLVRLKALEDRLEFLIGRADTALGLPIGRVVIEDFELAELRGGRMSLSQWRGRKLLLIFFDPTAAPSRQVVPILAALSATVTDSRPLPVIVSSGDPEMNQQVLASQGVACPILLQEAWELGEQFRVLVTPFAYVLDEEARIASPPAVGPAAILALGTADAATAPEQTSRSGPLAASAPRQTYPGHSGLAVGARAPAVHLPLLTGGTLSLAAYRGRRVLLVFLDPQHGPCLPLAARLEAIHRRTSTLAVVVVSRGSEQVNRDVAAELQLTFPIGLQQHWEVSRAYAIFAAPVAYLIDELGTIAHTVAIGADAILDLAATEQHDDTRVSEKGSLHGPD